MANPRPDTFVRFWKELYDASNLAPFPAVHREVFNVVVRRTDGDNGRPQAPVSVGCLMKATGRSKSAVKAARADLVDEGVLIQVSVGDPRSCSSSVFRVERDYEQWGKFSVDPSRIPNFLSHDYDVGRQADLGCEADLGQTAAQGRPSDRPSLGGEADPDLGHAKAHTKERTKDESKVKNSSPKPSRLSALSDERLQQEVDRILASTAFPADFRVLAELLAESNKTREVAVSRVLRVLYQPLHDLEGQVDLAAMRHGLSAAIAAGVPNATYVKRAAANYRPGGNGKGGGGRGLTCQEILSGSLQTLTKRSIDYDLEAEATDDD